MEKSQHTAAYRKLLMELKVARIRSGMTQRKASEKLKVYPSYVSKCEAGERKIDVLELAAFCRAYGLTLREFLGQVGIE